MSHLLDVAENSYLVCLSEPWLLTLSVVMWFLRDLTSYHFVFHSVLFSLCDKLWSVLKSFLWLCCLFCRGLVFLLHLSCLSLGKSSYVIISLKFCVFLLWDSEYECILLSSNKLKLYLLIISSTVWCDQHDFFICPIVSYTFIFLFILWWALVEESVYPDRIISEHIRVGMNSACVRMLLSVVNNQLK